MKTYEGEQPAMNAHEKGDRGFMEVPLKSRKVPSQSPGNAMKPMKVHGVP